MTQVENLIDLIRSAKSFNQAQVYIEALADLANVPNDWKAPGSDYTLGSVIQQIEDVLQIEVFGHNK